MLYLLLTAALPHKTEARGHDVSAVPCDINSTHEPDAFSALNYSFWKKPLVVEKPINDAGEKILESINSSVIAINMFWASSRDLPAHQQGSLASVHEESLWAELQERLPSEGDKAPMATGISRKRKTGKLGWPHQDQIAAYISLDLLGLAKVGDFAARYYLRRFLKSGNYGSVYLADTRSFSPVAVKIMHSRSGNLSGREIALHKHCSDHPYVIDVLDAFLSAFYVVLVMPLALSLHAGVNGLRA